MTGYHNWRTLPDYHLDFDKLCTTFKKRAQFSIKFLLHLCLLKWSFRCLFFIRGSVISFLLLKNHSLTKFLNCYSFSQIFGTFCTESTTAVSMTSFMWIQDLQASIFSELQGFLQVLQHPLFLPQHLQVHGHDPALWKESMSLSCELQTNRCKILYVCTSGCLHGSSHMSRWCTESDLA